MKFIKFNFTTNIVIFILPLSLTFYCCKKFVTVGAPNTALSGSSVYSNDATAISALTGLYTYMSQPILPFATGINSISIQSGLSSDELTLYGGSINSNLILCYKNKLSSQTNPPFWGNFFQFLININSAIEGLKSSKTLTQEVKQQLQGEAKFMRGFCFFYLAGLYGDVPLVLTSDYKTNSIIGRTSNSLILQQVISDFKDAQNLLSNDYLDATLLNVTTERTRPTKWAATAMLARAYLFVNDWTDAVAQSDSIINNSTAYSLVNNLNKVFLANSNEAIWQLQPVNAGWNTEDARVFILSASPNPIKPVYLSSFLLSAFENGDQRRINWIDSVKVGTSIYYYPYKYKNASLNTPVSEYLMVLRLAEQYLIRAEAEANGAGAGITAAINDLNIIRTRANLLPYSGPTDQTSVISSILHERQVELFTEWGHRWLDLKRTNNINTVMSTVTPQKGGIWNPDWQLYPLPLYDVQTDANLIQNHGY